jgi:hypothetical protein
MEQLDYTFLFRWSVGLNLDEPVWDVTVFTKNRERLLAGEVGAGFFAAVLEQARSRGLLTDQHFTVAGTLIEAWASHKSFQRKDAAPKTPPDDPGNPASISTACGAATTRTNRPPIPRPAWPVRAPAKMPSSATADRC